MKDMKAEHLTVRALGSRDIASPLEEFFAQSHAHAFYSDDERVLVDHNLGSLRQTLDRGERPACFEMAGPRRKNFFNPPETVGAIVTCGGLCPGLNDVIRAIVLQAHYRYGVQKMIGIPYGFEGLIPEFGHKLVDLTTEYVSSIHWFGGAALGS